MFTPIRERQVYHKLIALTTASFFFLNVFTADVLALAPELRTKSFSDASKLEFQQVYEMMRTASTLKGLIQKDEARPGNMVRLNNELKERFPDGEIEMETELRGGALSRGKEYKYAVFHFKKENRSIEARFFKDDDKLTDDELAELGVKTNDDRRHFFNSPEHPALRSVWFVKSPLISATVFDTRRYAEAGLGVINELLSAFAEGQSPAAIIERLRRYIEPIYVESRDDSFEMFLGHMENAVKDKLTAENLPANSPIRNGMVSNMVVVRMLLAAESFPKPAPKKILYGELLQEMYDNGIFSENPKKPDELAGPQQPHRTLEIVKDRLKLLKRAGLVKGDNNVGYYLRNCLRGEGLKVIKNDRWAWERLNEVHLEKAQIANLSKRIYGIFPMTPDEFESPTKDQVRGVKDEKYYRDMNTMLAKAIVYLTRVIANKGHPSDRIVRWANLTVSLYKAGFTDEARKMLEEAMPKVDTLNLYNEQASGLTRLGRAAYEIGLGRDKVLVILDMAQKRLDQCPRPDWGTIPLREMADLYVDIGCPEQAKEKYLKLQSIGDDLLAKCTTMKEGKKDDIGAGMAFNDALYGFGRLGLMEETEKLLEKVKLEMEPVRYSMGWEEAIKGLAKSGRIDEAVKRLKSVEWLNDTCKSTPAHWIMEALISKGDIERIFSDKILEDIGDHHSVDKARMQIAKKLAAEGNTKRAMALLDDIKAYEMSFVTDLWGKPKKSEHIYIKIDGLASVVERLAKDGDMQQAENVLAEMTRINVESTQWWFAERARSYVYLARALHAMGRLEEERKFLYEAREMLMPKEEDTDKSHYDEELAGISVSLIRLGDLRDLTEAIRGMTYYGLSKEHMDEILSAVIIELSGGRMDKATVEAGFKYIRLGFPYHKALIDGYFEAEDKDRYIAQTKARTDKVVEEGFDPENEKDALLAFLGTGVRGVNMDHETYETMFNGLMEYLDKHPQYFKNLFDKKGYAPFKISEKEGIVEDTGQVDATKVEEHKAKIYKILGEVLNLNGLDDQIVRKAYGYCRLTEKIKTDPVLAGHIGRIKMSDVNAHLKWHCPDFSIDAAKAYLLKLEDKHLLAEAIYFTAFNLYLNGKENRFLEVMLNCTIADALIDEALSDMIRESEDIATQLRGIAQIYTDSKFHIPSKLGLPLHKKLAAMIGAFSDTIFNEIGKVTTKKVVYETDKVYEFVPSKFLGVFRGLVVGDCTAREDMGKVYTRAMHEDTMYYMVYAAGKLTGYIGLMEAECEEGKVLTIDTMQMVPPKLVPDILKKLHNIAIAKGFIGIALPSDKVKVTLMAPLAAAEERDALWASFNYPEIRAVIKEMPAYKNGKPIKAKPIHKESWEDFRRTYGVHTADSIVTGAFVLVDLQKEGQRPSSDEPAPVAAQPAQDVSANFESVIAEVDRIHNENLNLTQTIPDKTIICHVVTDSLLPDMQLKNGVLNRLEAKMRSPKFGEKIVTLSVKNPDNADEFMAKLVALKGDIEKEYQGYKVQFDVACPRPEYVENIQKLGMQALAFKREGEGEIIQIEGIILALRALRTGSIASLINAYKTITGKDYTTDRTDINELATILLFTLPVRKIDVNQIGTINRLIEENIKKAA